MKRLMTCIFALLLGASLAFAQEAPKSSEQAAHEAQAAAERGEAKKEAAAADPHAQFMESPSVKWLARTLGVETKTASKISLGINFSILAFGLWFVTRKSVPAMFRDRTSAIQKGMEDARKASAEAAARLTEVEARLSRLDEEIAGIRNHAENEAKAEEERLRVATEEEKRKIVQSAEQEINAAANNARRELKSLAAELAVSLAEKKIAVSEDMDKALVKDFAASLMGNPDAKGRN